jgi:FkbM family methyltransferase
MKLFGKIQALRENLQFDNWPVAVMQRLFFRKEQLIVYRKNCVTALVDLGGDDQNGTRMCLASDMYSRWFSHFSKHRPLVVLDLGANGGGFSLSLLAAGYSFSKCVCVEMNPNTYIRLQFNLKYNCRRNGTAVNAAVAGRNGSVSIADCHGSTSGSIYLQSPNTGVSFVEVPLVTFDELATSHFGMDKNSFIDVCKMDVEGAEYEILHSDTCQSLLRTKFLIIEIHGGERAKLMERICSLGFHDIAADGKPNDGVHCFENTKMFMVR